MEFHVYSYLSQGGGLWSSRSTVNCPKEVVYGVPGLQLPLLRRWCMGFQVYSYLS